MAKLAFVMPWYGDDIPGGAESEARRTMKRLQAAGHHVEVLTTCIREFSADWGRNYHRAGVSTEGGITVRRFSVGSRNKRLFDQVNQKFMGRLPITAEEELVWLDNCFTCPDLFRFMGEHAADYIFFFIPYLFPTTVYGVQIAPERSVMIPCLHDEGYAYSRMQKLALAKPRVLLFHAAAEKRLAEQIIGENPQQTRWVIGEGVETDFDFRPDGALFRQKYQLEGKQIVLYVGRKESTKNLPLLLDYWRYFLYKTGSSAQLVLLGPGRAEIPADLQHRVSDLGFVPLADKWHGYAAADVVCQPSVNESFSLVMMESWVAETPVLVNGYCAVTRELCTEANAGLYFVNQEEFATTLEYLWHHRETAQQMGRNGREFVLKHYQWDAVIARYERVIEMMLNH